MVEEALLDPASRNSLNDGICSMPPLVGTNGADQSQWDKTLPQVTWTHAMQSFRSDNQHLELYPKANWQSVQLTRVSGLPSLVIR